MSHKSANARQQEERELREPKILPWTVPSSPNPQTLVRGMKRRGKVGRLGTARHMGPEAGNREKKGQSQAPYVT